MNRQSFLHGNLEGVDVDIETSLKEYGIAWIVQGDEVLFYYGIEHNDEEYTKFDFCSFPANMDVFTEFDWVKFEDVFSSIGQDKDTFKNTHFPYQIADLVSYYGSEEIFGTSYWEGLTYQGIWFSGR